MISFGSILFRILHKSFQKLYRINNTALSIIDYNSSHMVRFNIHLLIVWVLGSRECRDKYAQDDKVIL